MKKNGENVPKRIAGAGRSMNHPLFVLHQRLRGGDVGEVRKATKERKKVDRDISIQFEAHYFRFRDLVCEERVAGLFNSGSDLPLRSPPCFLLFPEDAK